MDSLKAYRDVKNSIDTALKRVSTATELPLEEIQKMRKCGISFSAQIYFSPCPRKNFSMGREK